MAKVFEVDINTGSFKDRGSGTLPTNTGVLMTTQEKGVCARFGASDDLDGYGVVTGVKTIVLIIRPTGDTKILQDDGTDRLEITGGSFSGTGITATYVNGASSAVALLGQWQLVICEFSAGIDFATDLEIDVTAACSIGKVLCDSEILTVDQREKLFQDFLRRTHIQKTIVVFPGTSNQRVSWQAKHQLRADGRTETVFLDGLQIESGTLQAIEGHVGNGDFGLEYIVNGDFEAAGDWTPTTATGSPTIYERSQEEAHSGIWSYKISLNALNQGVQQLGIPFRQYDFYVFSAWIYNASCPDGANFRINTPSIDLDKRVPCPTGVWTKLEGSAYLENADTSFRVYCNEGSVTSGIFYVDDVSVKLANSFVTKTVVCLVSSTISIPCNLSEFVGNGYIKNIGGSLSAESGKTVDAATGISWANNKLSISLTAGQTFTGITVMPEAQHQISLPATAQPQPIASRNEVWKLGRDAYSVAAQHGTITGATATQGVWTFDGIDDKITFPVVRGLKSIRLKVRLASTTEEILKLSATHSISATGGTLAATGFSSPTIYVDGSAGSTVTANTWHDIVITTATAIEADAFVLGMITGYLEGDIDGITIYDSVLSAGDVALLHTNQLYR